MVTSAALQELQAFRSKLYGCCTRRRDALFELVDALLTVDTILSLAYLSLEPIHRRGWGSTSAALATGQVDAEALRTLLARHQLAGGQPIYAVDVSTWPRCDAEASPERGFYYHPSRHSAGQPIITGWAFQWIAQLGFARDSWTAPVDARRCTRATTPTRSPSPRSARWWSACPPVRRRCLSSTPATTPPSSARGWPAPARRSWCGCALAAVSTPTRHCDDGQFGTVMVASWDGLHPKQQLHPIRGTKPPRPIVRGTLIRVQVSRIPARTRPPKVLWLWWQGPGTPDLEVLWRAYVRRFDLEHTIRFCKQTLGWTTPRVRHPEQAERWTWLVLAAYTQLRLARASTTDHRLPWERHLPSTRLTPVRVRRGFPRLLCAVGFAGQRAETLRALPRSTPGQPCRACQAVSGDQENPVTTTTIPGAPPATTAALPGTPPG